MLDLLTDFRAAMIGFRENLIEDGWSKSRAEYIASETFVTILKNGLK